MNKKIVIIALAILGFHVTTVAQGYRTTPKEKKESNLKLGKDIVAFSPMQVLLTSANQSTPDLAVNLSYEHILDNELIGIKLPVSVALNSKMFYAMPTFKLYPKKQGIAKFAVGPQLVIGYGNDSYEKTINNGNGVYYNQLIEGVRKQFGFAISPSVNFTIAKHMYVGVDASLGIMYYDSMPEAGYNYTGYNSQYSNNPVSPVFQFNFAFGYRF